MRAAADTFEWEFRGMIGARWRQITSWQSELGRQSVGLLQRKCIKVEEMGSSPSTPDPEYLAPEAGFNPPPPPVRRPRPSWAYAPATYVLVGINCLVFLVDDGARGQRLESHPRSTAVFRRRQCRFGAHQRRMDSHRHRYVRARGYYPSGHEYVVSVESGFAGRAADGFGGRAGGVHPYRRGRQPALHFLQLGLADFAISGIRLVFRSARAHRAPSSASPER